MEEDEMEEISEKLREIVRVAVGRLMEHFDSALIFVTKKGSDGMTFGTHVGSGNYHAQYGQTKRWVIMTEEEWKQDQRNEQTDG